MVKKRQANLVDITQKLVRSDTSMGEVEGKERKRAQKEYEDPRKQEAKVGERK